MGLRSDILGMEGFGRVMKQYMKVTSKTAVGAVNQKLYNIALKSLELTPNTKKGVPTKFWSPDNKKKSRNKYKRIGRKSKGKKGRSGKKGWSKSLLIPRVISAREKFTRATPSTVMWAAVEKQRNVRVSSISFLKSGWLPAIQTLGKKVSPDFKPRRPTKANKVLYHGKPYGVANPGKMLAKMSATGEMANLVGNYSAEAGAALIKHGKPALTTAIRMETADSLKYLARKLKKDADEVWRDIGGRGKWRTEKPKRRRRRR